jgi:DNA-binding response OmpR family regulator
MARVLIVFSDPAATEAPALVCDDAGHTVDFAPANAVASNLDRGFDLVVVTADEPLEPVRALRAQDGELPIVVVTLPLEEEAQRALHQERVRGIVFRPYAIQTLRKLLGSHVSTVLPEEPSNVLFEV